MPTLIRFFIVLLVLAGIVLAGMVALAMFVQPGQKEVRVRIPATQFGVEPTDDPLGLRTPVQPLPGATTTAAPPAEAAAEPTAPAAEPAEVATETPAEGEVDESGVRTVDIPE